MEDEDQIFHSQGLKLTDVCRLIHRDTNNPPMSIPSTDCSSTGTFLMIGDDHHLKPSVKIRSGFFPDPLGCYIPPLHTLAASTRSRAREPSIISPFSPGALLFCESCILTTSRAVDDSLVCLILGWIWTRRIQYACPLLAIFSSLPGFRIRGSFDGKNCERHQP